MNAVEIAFALTAAFVVCVLIGWAIGRLLSAECQAHDASREHWCEDHNPTHRGSHHCSCGKAWT